MLSPTWKKDPEVRVWKVSKLPELSVTTGSVQVTVVPVLKKGTTVVMSAGQEMIWGGTVSPVVDQRGNNICHVHQNHR